MFLLSGSMFGDLPSKSPSFEKDNTECKEIETTELGFNTQEISVAHPLLYGF